MHVEFFVAGDVARYWWYGADEFVLHTEKKYNCFVKVSCINKDETKKHVLESVLTVWVVRCSWNGTYLDAILGGLSHN